MGKKNQITVTVCGLGLMGSRIAGLLANAGHEVLAWNRTPGKIPKRTRIHEATSVLAAVTGSPLTMLVFYDNVATLDVFQQIDPEHFRDRVVINFTTGSPKEAEQLARIVRSGGGYYLTGAIQVAPDQVGTPDAAIFVSGDRVAYERCRAVFDLLAVNCRFLGDAAPAASAADMAMLTWFFGSYFGLLYAIKLSQHYGINLPDLSDLVVSVTPGFTEFFRHEIDVIARSDFRITQSPLSISVVHTQRIADSFQELNVNTDFVRLFRDMLARADKQGLRNQELAAIINLI